MAAPAPLDAIGYLHQFVLIRELNWLIFECLYTTTAEEGGKVLGTVQTIWETGTTQRQRVHFVDSVFESIKLFLTTLKAVGGATPRASRRGSPASRPSSASRSPESSRVSSRRSSVDRSSHSSPYSRDTLVEAGASKHFEMALEMFGHRDLKFDEVDVISKIITLGPTAQFNFGRFYWVIDATKTDEGDMVYRITHLDKAQGPRWRSVGALENARIEDGEKLLLDGFQVDRPDRKFFDLHAKVGRVLHASGVGLGVGGVVENAMRNDGHEAAATTHTGVDSSRNVNDFLTENNWIMPGHQQE
ncbi:uncharacterized protein EV422DRAFT_565163 [Fimicolochytrium jonesii]|uniref:uncharacterized protein n=1 Tax=Fimicolochytrium jonesii TaxID=1396493 RepID=UPI0022FE527D|nr:uncharacterized protein EV422DRAFT_565163 [Fimicolochytrium jonesii]KAI8824474.1 hypothetical protein EV422DRAFT_565163 [Fimicolochytrium jonesii]